MCCYESIVNQIIQKIIKEMHQTAAPAEREWARENILDAVVEESEKTVTFQVTTNEVRNAIAIGEIALPIYRAVQMAYPGYQVCAVTKEPLELAALATEKQNRLLIEP
jgi:hypothetical protein